MSAISQTWPAAASTPNVPPRPTTESQNIIRNAIAKLRVDILKWMETKPDFDRYEHTWEYVDSLLLDAGLAVVDNGYTIAKALDTTDFDMDYLIDAEFVRICDNWTDYLFECRDEAVADWVKAYQVKCTAEPGSKVSLDFAGEAATGQVKSVDHALARYAVWVDGEPAFSGNSSLLVEAERIISVGEPCLSSAPDKT